jgi:hypothetical protein
MAGVKAGAERGFRRFAGCGSLLLVPQVASVLTEWQVSLLIFVYVFWRPRFFPLFLDSGSPPGARLDGAEGLGLREAGEV